MPAFRDAPDARLRSFLIDEFRRRERSADALEHSLTAFAARPTLETYRELATDARALGQWTQRRTAALTRLRGPEPESLATSRHPSLCGRGCSELVRILLWEGDPDAAWQAANEGGCTDGLWLELADRRRGQHREDALSVYGHDVENIIGHKDKRSYEEAVRLIDDTIRTLFAECGRPEDFAAYVDDVRASHKQKQPDEADERTGSWSKHSHASTVVVRRSPASRPEHAHIGRSRFAPARRRRAWARRLPGRLDWKDRG